MDIKTVENQILLELVRLADKYDQEGQHELAQKIDETLKSFSARPKAPLKKLDDEVKRNLVVFVHDADKNTAKSVKKLKELFRRLRYFDLADSIKDTGLDKIVKELEKTQYALDDSKKLLYERMMGRKPSIQALKDFVGEVDEDSEIQPALDFFESQMAKDDKKKEDVDKDKDDEKDEDLEVGEEEELTEELEKELEEFLKEIEDDDELPPGRERSIGRGLGPRKRMGPRPGLECIYEGDVEDGETQV